MSIMKNIKLNIHLEVFDTFLYSGHLFVFLKDGSVGCINLNKIYHALYNENPDFVDFFRLIFQRNDYFKNKQGLNFFGINQFKTTFSKLWNKISKDLEFDYYISDELQIIGKIPEKDLPILDVKIYGMKIFIATLKGVYSMQLFETPNGFDKTEKVKKYFDAKSIYLNAKCGSLAISTNSDGLFYGSINGDKILEINEKEVTKKSVRTSWVNYDLINYETNESFEFLENQVTSNTNRIENSFSNEKTERNSITKFGIKKIKDEDITSNLNFDDENIKYVFNSSNSAFIITNKDRFYNSNIIVEKSPKEGILAEINRDLELEEKETQVRFSRKYFELPKIKKQNIIKPLSSHIIEKGCILEFFDKIVMFKNNDAEVIDSSETINLRTYQGSIRYKNLITIVKQDKITIHSIYPF